MKKVFIVGGNGFARECYYHLLLMMKFDSSICFGGFLGHGGYGHTVNYLDLQKFYLGEVSEHVFKEDEYVVIGAGYPEVRVKIYNDLKKINVKFFTICISETIKENVKIGEANVLVPPFEPSCNVEIGNNNVFNGDVMVGHDVKIGDSNFFGPRSQLLGNVKVGSFNRVGAGSVLLPHCSIGNHNKIAPLSAVYKGCKNNCYMLGNPAIKIGENND